MVSEEIVITSAIAAGGYVGTQLFGSALATMGEDINKLYAKGRDKLVDVATKKINNPDDGKKVNLRAARDVLWNGAITEDEVCAEYFGGMLAASRSPEGKDDGVLNYVDTIKSMSSRQLELHYVIYKTWQNILLKSKAKINAGLSEDVNKYNIFLIGGELKARNLDYDRDLTVLHRQGLVNRFSYKTHIFGNVAISLVEVVPTTYGVMLFAAAHNKLDEWREFYAEEYISISDIEPLDFFGQSLEELKLAAGIP
ncbi:hypothetical protein GJV26_00210 [Massilia dura]|uniref:DUF4393 domain-containing protein n=1 Tax=Pseudoduganella dura TaxID=321982 RepID=A0A6I3X8H6_9BURK|nr:hypothetical protein [Pseudoduganella dura]MUI10920.1 hypothetical protein [Pseudoduganella dura]GGY12799.1 hypothetical protein GCM10007386_48930 [Pseudoduganella dura]